ncbi:hypothetical protein ACOI9X_13440 [Pseudomonas sp. P2757]|uniref:hypothetical protein n=1 Tax=unclassified Pseudomonas TaxID=196821 RepID=UPI003B5C40A1
MDEIEELLSYLEGERDQEYIDSTRIYLSGLSKEKFESEKANFLLGRKYEANYKLARQQQPVEWEAIRKTASKTNILIHIYNHTHETFSLISSTWDGEPEDFEIPPGNCYSLLLPNTLLRRTSSGKQAFQSSLISHTFTYSSGDYAFGFATAMTLTNRGYEPFAFDAKSKVSRQHSIRSLGQREIRCQYALEQNQSATPYSYALKIQIEY